MNNETTCVVIVTYNRKNLLVECLEALLNQTSTLNCIFIIDNASTDGTCEYLICNQYLAKVNDKVEDNCVNEIKMSSGCIVEINYLRLTTNEGGSKGFSVGVKKAYSAGYDWIWVMDDDVRPDKDCLLNLKEISKTTCVRLPLKVDNHNSIIDWSGLSYDLTNPFKKNPKVPVLKKYKSISQLPSSLSVEDMSFEGPLFPRSVIEKIGYPRDNFFLLFDDTEYALRARKNGFKILLARDARIIKDKVITIDANKVYWKDYYYKRNLMVIRRIYGKNLLVKFLNPLIFTLVCMIFRLLKLDWSGIIVCFFAYVDSLREKLFFRFRPGQ